MKFLQHRYNVHLNEMSSILFFIHLLYYTTIFLADQGDFDPEHHNVAFISEFRFVENQNEQFEIDVLEQYRKLQ